MRNSNDSLDHLFLDSAQRDIEPHAGAIGSSIMRIRNVDSEKRTVEAVVSTPNIDRYEEAVEPRAFEKMLPVFMSNPVLVAGHTYVGINGEPTVIGSWLSLRIEKDGLVGVAKFAGTALADEYWQLYRDGHMKAFSVGWITRAFEMRDTKMPDGQLKRIRWFTEVELIEISAVAIPANRESLVRAASAFARLAGATPLAPLEQKGERLGRRIRARREEKEMTLEEVAAQLPITASTLQNIENGTIIRPPDEVLSAIAEALDLSLRELQRLADQDQADQGASGGDGDKQIDEAALEKALRKILNTDPGGILHTFFLDVVDAVQGRDGHGYLDDDPPPPVEGKVDLSRI